MSSDPEAFPPQRPSREPSRPPFEPGGPAQGPPPHRPADQPPRPPRSPEQPRSPRQPPQLVPPSPSPPAAYPPAAQPTSTRPPGPDAESDPGGRMSVTGDTAGDKEEFGLPVRSVGNRPQSGQRGGTRPAAHPDRGRTKIAEEVVAKIAILAARQVEGVHGLGGDVAHALGGVHERPNREKTPLQGVAVEMVERRVIVDVVIVIRYGYVIMEVTSQVRFEIISAVERMLGLRVVEVNIAVEDVHPPADGKAGG